jgi:hypothetical protein
METDIIGGVAQGAAVGASFGVPGAIAGGIIGGIGGLLGGKQRKKAARRSRQAERNRTLAAILRNYGEQRTQLRMAQVAGAEALSAAVTTGADVGSSMTAGIQNSIYAQAVNNYALGSDILGYQLKANQLDASAGKAAGRANTINDIMGAGEVIAGLFPRDPPVRVNTNNTSKDTSGKN